MIIRAAGRVFGDALIALAYPQPCMLCGRSVEETKYGVACEACWIKTSVFDGSETLCWKCGVRVPAEIAEELRDQVRCHRCDAHSFTAARAVGLYEGPLREAVLQLKRRPHVSAYL